MSATSVEAAKQVLNRRDDSDTQGSTDGLPVPSGGADDLEYEWGFARPVPKRLLTQHAPQHGERVRMIDGPLKIELEIRARIRPLCVDQAQLTSIRTQHPCCVKADPSPDCVAPQIVE